MQLGQIVIVVYAALLLVGGWIGYKKAHSKPSLISGAVSAGILMVAWLLSRSGTPTHGYWMAAAVSLLMCVAFGIRLRKSGKFMPSGMLLVISGVSLALLCFSALTSE